jgi:hypothetical protein
MQVSMQVLETAVDLRYSGVGGWMCVCERERESECVCEREREREKERER